MRFVTSTPERLPERVSARENTTVGSGYYGPRVPNRVMPIRDAINGTGPQCIGVRFHLSPKL